MGEVKDSIPQIVLKYGDVLASQEALKYNIIQLVDEFEDEISKKDAKIKKLIEAIKTYGKHLNYKCEAGSLLAVECTCGFQSLCDDLLKESK